MNSNQEPESTELRFKIRYGSVDGENKTRMQVYTPEINQMNNVERTVEATTMRDWRKKALKGEVKLEAGGGVEGDERLGTISPYWKKTNWREI